MNSLSSLNSQFSTLSQADAQSHDNGIYIFVKFLGRGSFGSVNLYRHSIDNSLVVWKEIDLSLLNERFRHEAFAEIDILSIIDHANIISYYKYFFDEKHLYIELCYANGGTLAQLIKDQIARQEYFQEDTVLWYLYQLCNAVAYIHHIGIIHRDIKSANIFFMKSGLLKLGDFGIAKIIDPENGLAETQVGTPLYMSPEIINGLKYNSKSDIWSIGIVLHEMLALQKLFNATNELRIALQIIQCEPEMLDLEIFSRDLRELAKLMLTKDPHGRPSAKQILENGLFSEKIIEYEYKIEQLNKATKRSSLGLNEQNNQIRPIVASKLSELFVWGGGKHSPQKIELFKKENAPLRACVSKTHYVVLTVEKEVYTWSTPSQANSNCAKLGHGKATKQPKKVNKFEGIFIEQISCGDNFTCCLSEHGVLYVFGTDYCGCLGLGDVEDIYEPTMLAFFEENNLKIHQVSCGNSHVIVLCSNGDVYSWGCGEYGRLGVGNEDNYTTPQKLNFKFNYKFTSVIACADCTFLVTDTGKVLACGNNEYNKLGLNSELKGVCSQQSSPQEIIYQTEPKLISDLSPYKIVKIASGETHTAIIDCYGRLFTMGSNKYGQLGSGDLRHHTGINMVRGLLSGHFVTNVSCGDSFTICSTANSHVFAWGNCRDGRLGIDANVDLLSSTISSPKAVFGSLFCVNDISSSHWYSIIIAEMILEAKQVKSMAFGNQRNEQVNQNHPQQQNQQQHQNNLNECLDSAYGTCSISNQNSVLDHEVNVIDDIPLNVEVVVQSPEEAQESITEIPEWLKQDLVDAEYIPMDRTPLKIEDTIDINDLLNENRALKEENQALRHELIELKEKMEILLKEK